VVGDRAFYCSTDKCLYAVDLRDGRLIARLNTKARCFSSPTLIDGRVYFGNNNGTVYEVDPASVRVTGEHQLPDRVVGAIVRSPVTGYYYAHTSDARIFAFAREAAA
jgi:outer membrane protein assembly factor BamB